jgi:hypothetical protein
MYVIIYGVCYRFVVLMKRGNEEEKQKLSLFDIGV